MGETKHMLFARNLITICVDDQERADFQGTLWHQYSDEPISFGSMTSMLTKMDGLMDEWDFPQKGLDQRVFIKEDKPRHSRDRAVDGELIIDKVQEMNGTRNIQNKRGRIATFVVQVAMRQNATWQGRVVSVDDDVQEDFQSAMELMRIMLRRIEGKNGEIKKNL